MVALAIDLDNTLIYSYRHNIGEKKICVEMYQGREVSFVTPETIRLLNKLKDELCIIPTTTRSIEQYKRIDLKSITPRYALVCNGGILLENGKIETEWLEESRMLIKPSVAELEKAMKLLDVDERRIFELRFIEKLFVFTKCDNPEAVVLDLKEELDSKHVDIFNNGTKVYVVPKSLDKGKAIERLRNRLQLTYVYAAGDSEFDIPLVSFADQGIVPAGLKKDFDLKESIKEMSGEKLFAEELLEYVNYSLNDEQRYCN